MNIAVPCPREATIWLVNDKPENITAGNGSKIRLLDLIVLCSLGKSRAKIRNAVGIIADVAKLILPQNSIEGDPFEKYIIKTLNPHPAPDQDRRENVKFTRLCVPVFL